MRKNTIVILILVSVLVMMFLSSCGNDDKPRVITGTLISLDLENGTVNIDGSDYKVAEGMKAFESQAEEGKRYEFTLDEHGNIIAASLK